MSGGTRAIRKLEEALKCRSCKKGDTCLRSHDQADARARDHALCLGLVPTTIGDDATGAGPPRLRRCGVVIDNGDFRRWHKCEVPPGRNCPLIRGNERTWLRRNATSAFGPEPGVRAVSLFWQCTVLVIFVGRYWPVSTPRWPNLILGVAYFGFLSDSEQTASLSFR
jgi:hypothetical protein